MSYKNKYQHLMLCLFVSRLSRNLATALYSNEFLAAKNQKIVNIRIYGHDLFERGNRVFSFSLQGDCFSIMRFFNFNFNLTRFF